LYGILLGRHLFKKKSWGKKFKLKDAISGQFERLNIGFEKIQQATNISIELFETLLVSFGCSFDHYLIIIDYFLFITFNQKHTR